MSLSELITKIEKKSPDFNSNFRDLWGLSVITGDTSSLVDILKHNKETIVWALCIMQLS